MGGRGRYRAITVLEAIGSGGRILSSKSVNRTATFVFYIGESHFGTLTAHVPGGSAENFTFTSALPVQVLKGMAPILTQYLPTWHPHDVPARPGNGWPVSGRPQRIRNRRYIVFQALFFVDSKRCHPPDQAIFCAFFA